MNKKASMIKIITPPDEESMGNPYPGRIDFKMIKVQIISEHETSTT